MARLITLEEAAARLSMSPQSVLRLVRTGALPAQRSGAAYHFDPAVLDSYVERCGRGSAPAASSPASPEPQPPVTERTALPVEPAPHPAIGPVDRGRGITEDQARRAEETFLRSFDQRLRALRRICDLQTGAVTELSTASISMELLGRRRSARQAPLNRIARYTISTGSWPAVRDIVVLEAHFLCRVDVLASRGRDSEPLVESVLLEALNRAGQRLQLLRCFHLLLFASPTGWAPSAIRLCTDPAHRGAFSDPMATVVLADLASGEVLADEEDLRLAAYWRMLDPGRFQHLLPPVLSRIRETLLLEPALPLRAASAACGIAPSWAAAAFAELLGEHGLAMKQFPDAGLVLYRSRS